MGVKRASKITPVSPPLGARPRDAVQADVSSQILLTKRNTIGASRHSPPVGGAMPVVASAPRAGKCGHPSGPTADDARASQKPPFPKVEGVSPFPGVDEDAHVFPEVDEGVHLFPEVDRRSSLEGPTSKPAQRQKLRYGLPTNAYATSNAVAVPTRMMATRPQAR